MFGFLAGIGWKALGAKAIGNAASDARAVGHWLGSLDLVHFLLLAACLFGGWQTVGRWSQHRHTVKVEAQLSQCTAARQHDAETYAKAQADAHAANLAQVAADKAQRERITHDVSQSYETELASLRADLARRLRPQPPTTESVAAAAGLPGVSAAPSGPDASARVSIPASLYVRGAELELQLERLQQWISKQAEVNPNDHR